MTETKQTTTGSADVAVEQLYDILYMMSHQYPHGLMHTPFEGEAITPFTDEEAAAITPLATRLCELLRVVQERLETLNAKEREEQERRDAEEMKAACAAMDAEEMKAAWAAIRELRAEREMAEMTFGNQDPPIPF